MNSFKLTLCEHQGESRQHSSIMALKPEQLDMAPDPTATDQLTSYVKHHVVPPAASEAQRCLSALKEKA